MTRGLQFCNQMRVPACDSLHQLSERASYLSGEPQHDEFWTILSFNKELVSQKSEIIGTLI